MSKWDKSKLSNDQIMYGADDALVGLQALAALTQKLGAHAVFQALESDSSAAAKLSSGKNISDSQTDRHSESQSTIKTQNLKEWTHNISPTRSKSIIMEEVKKQIDRRISKDEIAKGHHLIISAEYTDGITKQLINIQNLAKPRFDTIQIKQKWLSRQNSSKEYICIERLKFSLQN